ncbi:MAG TPA: biotin carboxylase N-terminal domain-containing protein [Acidimicrobiales bacterium]
MFETVLIANRGEIAVRIIRTLRRLGIKSVAVYSDVDRGARHVLDADEALYLGATAPHESYLNIDRVLDACVTSGSHAVHPGYGFLSESADFALACAERGITFIGPSARAISLMGDKIQAKLHVAAAGVPVVPGRINAGMTDGDLRTAAMEVGFPVLIKPSAGGGGKGMRLVEGPDDLSEALTSSRREALSSFGDDALFLERFVVRPRHIEVQVLGDEHGTVVHLGERECSLQRRHQKVVEEAPSPLLDDATRQRLCASAIDVARSVDYSSVGTVEYIVSSQQPDEFFFMEMNTRLQVEHPVTEMVTGLDLVEQQLLVAAGLPLAIDVLNARVVGHAVEARVYAESPARGFLPTSGRLLKIREPSGEGVRVDSGLLEGLDVATQYDPMLAKVVAWGPDRLTALRRLHTALGETVILGVGTNVDFLRRLLRNDDVAMGNLDTGLIQREVESLVSTVPSRAVLALYALSWQERLAPNGPVRDPWDAVHGWRLGKRDRPLTLVLPRLDGGTVTVTMLGTIDNAQLCVDGVDVELSVTSNDDGGVTFSTDGDVHRGWYVVDGRTTWDCVDGETWPLVEADIVRRRVGRSSSSNDVRSPMPGTVLGIRVTQGQSVRAGDALVVVSAMKMEHVLLAPRDGTADILVREGDSVVVDEVVARLIPSDIAQREDELGESTSVATAVGDDLGKR